jgi:hypothetical protein
VALVNDLPEDTVLEEGAVVKIALRGPYEKGAP